AHAAELAFGLRPGLLHLAEQFLPLRFLEFGAMASAGGQDDLDACVAQRANRDVVEVGRVEAALQRRDQLLLVVVLRLLVGVDLVDQDGPANQINTRLEARPRQGLAEDGDRLLGVVPEGDPDEDDPDDNGQDAKDESSFERFHVRGERLSWNPGERRLISPSPPKRGRGEQDPRSPKKSESVTCRQPFRPWPAGPSLPWSGCARCCRATSAVSRCRPP